MTIQSGNRVAAVPWLQAEAGLSVYGAQKWIRESGIDTLIGGEDAELCAALSVFTNRDCQDGWGLGRGSVRVDLSVAAPSFAWAGLHSAGHLG